MTQTALAKKMRVSRPYVVALLSGRDVNFTFKTAYRMAKALQLDFFPDLRKQGGRLPRASWKLEPAV